LEFAWIHFMMLSTLIPTLIHSLVAGFAAVLLLPETWRDWILRDWEEHEDARMVAFLMDLPRPDIGSRRACSAAVEAV